MQRWQVWVAGLVVVGWAGNQVLGQQPERPAGGDRQAPAERAVQGDRPATAERAAAGDARGAATEWDAVAKDLNLTEDQQARISEKKQAMQTALADWDKQNREKAERLQADMQAARQAGDWEAMRRLQEEGKPLREERANLENGYKNQIRDILTPEQRLNAAGLKMLQDRDYLAMVRELKLSAEQEAQLKEKMKAAGMGVAKWDMENGEKLRTLEKQMVELQATLRPLQVQREELMAQQKAGILEMLTPEQKLAWISYKLQEDLTGRAGRAKLTDEQTAKIKTLCDAAAKEFNALPGTDNRAREQVREKLSKTVLDEVLTDAQRAELSGGRAREAAKSGEAPARAEAPRK